MRVHRGARVVGRVLVLEGVHDGLDVRTQLLRLPREVAHDAMARDAMVEQGCLGDDDDAGLLVGELGADGDLDLEDPAVELGHGFAKVREDPDKGVFVFQGQVDGEVLAEPVFLDDLVKVALHGDREAEVLGLGLQTVLGPARGLLHDGFSDRLEAFFQPSVAVAAGHGVAGTLEGHVHEFVAGLVDCLFMLDGVHVRIKVPQEAALAEVIERLEGWLVRLVAVISTTVKIVVLVLVFGAVKDGSVGPYAHDAFKSIDYRDTNAFVAYLGRSAPVLPLNRKYQRGVMQKTYLCAVSILVFFIVVRICIFKARLVLIRVGRHKALYREQNRLQALSGRPLLSSRATPGPVCQST